MHRLIAPLAVMAALIAPAAAPAQELLLGGGHAAFNAERAEDGGILAAEYRWAPFGRMLGGDAMMAAAADVTTSSDAFLGLGVAMRWPLGSRWFVDASVMPGYYSAGDDDNRLGGQFQFRSTLGLGVSVGEAGALSLAVSHKSNANTQNMNPGLESLMLRWHWQF